MCSLHERSRPHEDEESRLLILLVNLLCVILIFVTPWALIENAKPVAKLNKPAVVSAEKNIKQSAGGKNEKVSQVLR